VPRRGGLKRPESLTYLNGDEGKGKGDSTVGGEENSVLQRSSGKGDGGGILYEGEGGNDPATSR